jgi:hypothetical protein
MVKQMTYFDEKLADAIDDNNTLYAFSLLDRGANPNSHVTSATGIGSYTLAAYYEQYNASLMFLAIENHNTAIVSKLISSGAFVNDVAILKGYAYCTMQYPNYHCPGKYLYEAISPLSYAKLGYYDIVSILASNGGQASYVQFTPDAYSANTMFGYGFTDYIYSDILDLAVDYAIADAMFGYSYYDTVVVDPYYYDPVIYVDTYYDPVVYVDPYYYGDVVYVY